MLGIFVTFSGVQAILITSLALKKFTKGEFKKYVTWITVSLIALTINSTYHTLMVALKWREKYGIVMEYPEYVFMSLTYVFFFIAANDLYEMSKVYGFKTEGKLIEKAMKEKQGKEAEID